MDELNTINALMPQSIKESIYNNGERKLASVLTGMQVNDFTLDKIAAYLGARGAARRAKWASICSGILALGKLEK